MWSFLIIFMAFPLFFQTNFNSFYDLKMCDDDDELLKEL